MVMTECQFRFDPTRFDADGEVLLGLIVPSIEAIILVHDQLRFKSTPQVNMGNLGKLQ